MIIADIRATETTIVGLIVVASLVAIGAWRARMPYSVALVLVGLVLGVIDVFGDVRLTADIILLVFVPPLLFEGAINLDLRELVRRRVQIGVLAVAGTVVAALFMVFTRWNRVQVRLRVGRR